MKNLSKLLLGLIFASVLVTGCKEAEEILYVNFNADYETQFDVTVPAAGGKTSIDGTFSVEETIDPTTNSDYNTYIDNIKEVDIQEVSGTILEISKNVILNNATISVTNNNYTASWTFNNEPITLGTTLALGNEQGQWDSMTEIMLGKAPFTVSINGQTDEDDVEFVVLFTLKSEVTASPIQ